MHRSDKLTSRTDSYIPIWVTLTALFCLFCFFPPTYIFDSVDLGNGSPIRDRFNFVNNKNVHTQEIRTARCKRGVGGTKVNHPFTILFWSKNSIYISSTRHAHQRNWLSPSRNTSLAATSLPYIAYYKIRITYLVLCDAKENLQTCASFPSFRLIWCLLYERPIWWLIDCVERNWQDYSEHLPYFPIPYPVVRWMSLCNLFCIKAFHGPYHKKKSFS